MPRHVVVDGSNIATEGRTLPSLKQLNDAVLAFMQDNPDDLITVVVDATFGHRIAASEVPEYDAAIENNELVCPPAGAIGRGDAFVLTIAHKAGAAILSNDSFQEFHGDYPWLFDEGRLVGGKPVPNIGWVFVNRAPVRGPVSRRSVRDAKKGGREKERDRGRGSSRPSKAASAPMPTPKVPPPARKPAVTAAVPKPEPPAEAPHPARHVVAPSPAKHEPINELLPFLGFVEAHPVGALVDATVESYSSHGAYVRIGDVRAYAPLRFLADPAPRSAREVLAIGQVASFVVVSFNAGRRGIDLALPGFQPADVVVLETAPAARSTAAGAATKPAKKAKKAKKAAPAAPEPVEAPVVEAEPTPTRRRGAKQAQPAAEAAVAPTRKARGKAVPAPAAEAPADTPAAPPAKKAPARASKKATAEAPAAPAPRGARTRTPKVGAPAVPTDEATAAPAPAEAPPARTATKAPTEKAPAKKAPAKAAAKKVPAKAAAKKAPAKKVPAKTPAPPAAEPTAKKVAGASKKAAKRA
jgi:hypothetical protein